MEFSTISMQTTTAFVTFDKFWKQKEDPLKWYESTQLINSRLAFIECAHDI